MTLGIVLSLMQHGGYFTHFRPYELNILGIRSNQSIANRFDDRIIVFFKTAKGWEQHRFNVTTDPGTFWLQNPSRPEGTAILASGQYRDAYQLGLHQGQYTALVQRSPVDVIRDYDRNAILDFFNGYKQSGMFGINIHRAKSEGSTKTIDKYSAGCQVFENASDFDVFIQMCEYHKSLYGNRFTYTLEDYRAIRRTLFRRTAGVVLSATIGCAGYQFIVKPKIQNHGKPRIGKEKGHNR